MNELEVDTTGWMVNTDALIALHANASARRRSLAAFIMDIMDLPESAPLPLYVGPIFLAR
jgi:hypothetical protein